MTDNHTSHRFATKTSLQQTTVLQQSKDFVSLLTGLNAHGQISEEAFTALMCEFFARCLFGGEVPDVASTKLYSPLVSIDTAISRTKDTLRERFPEVTLPDQRQL